MASVLTIEQGYLKYAYGDGKNEWIPLTLLAQCRLVEWTTYVAIVFPQGENTPSSTPEIKIFPTAALTTVGAVLASLQAAQTSSASAGNGTYAEKTYVVTGYIYTGIAAVGSATSAAVWKVSRTTDATPFTTTWANSGKFLSIMDNYASLTYE